jgi:hypothetical protein
MHTNEHEFRFGRQNAQNGNSPNTRTRSQDFFTTDGTGWTRMEFHHRKQDCLTAKHAKYANGNSQLQGRLTADHADGDFLPRKITKFAK